jgi:hypothetical protein
MGSSIRRRNKMIPIRLDEDEYSKIAEKAKHVGVTVPAYLRGIALQDRPPIISKRNWEDISYRLFDIADDVEGTLKHSSIGYYVNFAEAHDTLLKIQSVLEEISQKMDNIRQEAGVMRKK